MDNSRELYCQILCTLVFVILIVRTVSEYPLNQCAYCDCCAGACDVSNNYACDDAGCIAGYWGISQCLHRCFDKEPCLTCGQYGGKWCYACYDGYYVPTNKTSENAHCTLTCHSRCKTCIASSTNCQICRDGYVNIGDSTDCDNCVNGRLGILCDQLCPSNCKKHVCFRINGTCAEGCADGYYGQDCNTKCSMHCFNRNCDSDSGKCKDGCDSNVITGERCDACVDGRFGDLCEHACPINCKDNICNKTNGSCTLGCKIYFVGNKCEQCVSDKYGNNCLLDCPVNCLNGVCSNESGVCLLCEENFSGDRCDTCTDGFYGTACSEECSVKCLHQNCDKETGHCLACENNRFGYDCENLCPLTCRRMDGHIACDVFNGTCLLECEIGLYGVTCQKTCQPTCVNQACNIDTGKCSLGCVSSFKGEYCISDDAPSTAPTYGLLGALCLAYIVIIGMAVYIWKVRRILNKRIPMKQADDAGFSTIPTETSHELQDAGTVDSSVSFYEMLERNTVVSTNIYSNIENDN